MESVTKKTSRLFFTVWTRVILDEAHRICERSSKTSKSISQLRACNRWCLTGTPYKNGLSDIVALCKFLKIQPYCKASWWKHNAHNDLNLHMWRSAFVHIRYKSTSFLPPLKVKQRSIENTLSEMNVQNTVRNITLQSSNKNKLQEFELLKILRMRQSAVHPFLFLSDAARQHLLYNDPCMDPEHCSACGHELGSVDSLEAAVAGAVAVAGAAVEVENLDILPDFPAATTADEEPEFLFAEDGCTIQGSWTEPWSLRFEKGTTHLTCANHVLCAKCGVNTLVCPTCIASSLPRCSTDIWLHSTKTRELLRILTKCVSKGNKTVLFSQWTTCLDLVQSMLKHHGIQFCRFDGTVTTLEERSNIVEQFGKSSNVLVMLTSLGAGGEGINLTCANTVILLEPYWNSAIEQQAIDRVHRLGQQDITRVYKLLLQNSVEDWVLDLQKLKQQEQHYYLKGTTPIAPQVPPGNTSLGKRHQRLLDKTSGTSLLNGNWKKTGAIASKLATAASGSTTATATARAPTTTMLSQFIF
jgi:DNA repair protein RAD5